MTGEASGDLDRARDVAEASQAAVLNYEAPLVAPRRLTLREGDGMVRVIFPVAPAWAYAVGIGGEAAVGLIKLATAIWLVWFLTRVAPPGAMARPEDLTAIRSLEAEILGSALLVSTFWFGCAGYSLWMYRRWGRVPRTLTAGEGGLVLSKLGWIRMRERTWPADEIAGIELRAVKHNLNWRRTAADLYIRRHGGRRLRFRVSSPDAALPREIAEKIAGALGRRLS